METLAKVRPRSDAMGLARTVFRVGVCTVLCTVFCTSTGSAGPERTTGLMHVEKKTPPLPRQDCP